MSGLTVLHRFAKAFRRQVGLSRRREEEESQQRSYGYTVRLQNNGPDDLVRYEEGEKYVNAQVSFRWDNDSILFTESLRSWTRPRGERIEGLEHLKIVNRIVRYLSVWGDVFLSDQRLIETDEMAMKLKERGVEYEEIDGVLVWKANIDEERKREDSIVNR